MRIEILSEAEDDLVAGAKFYERRRAGLEPITNSSKCGLTALQSLKVANRSTLAQRTHLSRGNICV